MKTQLIKTIPILILAVLAGVSCSKKVEEIQEERVPENRVIYELRDAQKVRTPIVLAGSTMRNILDGSSVNIPYEIELGPYEYTIMMN